MGGWGVRPRGPRRPAAPAGPPGTPRGARPVSPGVAVSAAPAAGGASRPAGHVERDGGDCEVLWCLAAAAASGGGPGPAGASSPAPALTGSASAPRPQPLLCAGGPAPPGSRARRVGRDHRGRAGGGARAAARAPWAARAWAGRRETAAPTLPSGRRPTDAVWPDEERPEEWLPPPPSMGAAGAAAPPRAGEEVLAGDSGARERRGRSGWGRGQAAGL